MPQTKTTWPIASKKLIDFGWHSPTPEYLQGNLARIEKLPFDGVSIKLPDDAGGGYVFDLKKGAAVKAEARNRQAKLLMALPKSKTLTHNFLTVHGTSTLDWFSDSDWRKAETQLRWVAQLAAQARLAGIVWDAEPYNDFPCWSYARQPQKDKYSFADYYKIVRQRGAQFIKALQEEFPGLTVLSLRQLSDFQDGSPFSANPLPNPTSYTSRGYAPRSFRRLPSPQAPAHFPSLYCYTVSQRRRCTSDPAHRLTRAGYSRANDPACR